MECLLLKIVPIGCSAIIESGLGLKTVVITKIDTEEGKEHSCGGGIHHGHLQYNGHNLVTTLVKRLQNMLKCM